MSSPLQGTASAAKSIARVNYTHDAMIDLIIAQPGISQNDIAKHFGYTAAWVSQVHNSDAFQARLAERKADVVDPVLLASIEEKFKGAVSMSLDILARKLEATQSADLALKVADIGVRALGYGAKTGNVNVQQNFVVALPGKTASAEDWARQHGPGGKILEQE